MQHMKTINNINSNLVSACFLMFRGFLESQRLSMRLLQKRTDFANVGLITIIHGASE